MLVSQERRTHPAITSFGSATGSLRFTNDGLDERLGRRIGLTDRAIKKEGIGIAQRFWAADQEATSDLATRAIQEAIKNRGIDPSKIASVVIGTSSPDYQGVSTGAIVQYKAGLPTDISYKNISNACPGWVESSHVAVMSLTSEYGRRGPHIAVGAEVISRNLSPRKSNVILFGDAAGATIWENVDLEEGDPEVLWFESKAEGAYAKDLYIPAGGSVMGTSAETVAGDLHAIDMTGSVVFDRAVAHMTDVTTRALAHAGIPIQALKLFIPHQANLKIIRAVADSLGISMDKVMVTIDRFGNTSAASVPTAMHAAVLEGRIKKNDLIAAASFGAGIGSAAMVSSMNGLPKRAKEIFEGVEIPKPFPKKEETVVFDAAA